MTALGCPRVHHRRTDSTNERARRLAGTGAPHGTLVTAEEQTAGRGRQGRTWTAPPGRALLASLLLRDPAWPALLPLAAAVATAEACDAVAPVHCAIKWPNDVWVGGRKVAGILVEGRPGERWAVVGVGVNVSTSNEDLAPELRETATSLAIAAGGTPPTVESLLDALLAALERWHAAAPSALLTAWRGRDALAGRVVRWREGRGTARGVDDAGALLVDSANGRIALRAGEVHLCH